MAVIELSHITKQFSRGPLSITVLNGINLTIERGEMVAITGRSGSGKSTLMHIIGCLDTPTSGTYIVDGHDVSQLSPDELAHIRNQKIGFVFQQFNLLQDLTALENVALPLLYGGHSEHDANERAKKMLALMELSDRLDHYPNQLSGGQQQRVAIARALINKPAILLADEPTGNLDSKTSNEVIALFKNLNQQEKLTIILVTHDAQIAAQVERKIVLLDGHVVE